MIPNLAYQLNQSWAIGPVVVYTITFLTICMLLLTRSSTRGFIGYTSAIGAFAGMVYTALIVAMLFAGVMIAIPIFFVFFAICITFTFLPGLVAFGRIAKQKGSKVGKLIVGFGYLWAFIVVVIGLALGITLGVKLGASDVDFFYSNPYIQINNLYMFLIYSPWAFVAAYLILLGALSSSLARKSKITLIVYSVLNIFALLVFTICIHITDDRDLFVMVTVIYSILLALSDIPFAVALMVATYYGHLWNIITEDNTKGEVGHSNMNANQIDIEKN